MPDLVSVIVPVWNGRELVARLLRALAVQTHPVAEVVVVDNGSEDGAAEAAERLGARVVRMWQNTGFSRAVNRGIEECNTPWLAIMNTDVEPARDWLERLMAAAGSPDTWFVAGKLLSASDHSRIDGTWDAVCRGGCAWRVGHDRIDGPEFSSARSIWFAPGTAALFRAELFRRAGLFDEAFESYLEDVEFGLRCACLNYAGLYAPGAVAYHVGSATLGRWHPEVVRRIARNQVLLVAKYYPSGLLLRFAWPVLASQALWGIVSLRHGAFGAYLRGKLEGLLQFFETRRSSPPVESRRVEEILRVSEREISRVQRQTGFDRYWRVYLALTAGGSD